MRRSLVCVLALFVVVPASASARWLTLRDPINPAQLTKLPFGYRSQWLQPWRSTLTTRSARSLQGALGINFNVTPQQADATARLLADSGIRRARLELPWDGMSYADPARISAAARPSWETYLRAFRRYHLRPLILLNANSGLPGPALTARLTAIAPARAGSRQVQLDPADVARIVPGLTGIDSGGDAAGVLITAVTAEGVATLSRPLPASLGRGPVAVTTMRYAPFAPPLLAGGGSNPRFQRTLNGWLTYARAVCAFVRRVYGSGDFDVEVWNELSFGSDFLYETRYFDPVPDPGARGDVTRAILTATIRGLHRPGSGFADVNVGDGFASQTPFASGATEPPGTAAIDHHPYAGAVRFPSEDPVDGVTPVDALGAPAFRAIGAGASRRFADVFSPRYRAFFPEYYLTGIQTETLMRDLSPLRTTVYGVPFGARTHPAHARAPANWITEDNLDMTTARALGVPAADLGELQAKAALRFYVAYASEGAQAIDLYAAAGGGCCQLIAQHFLDATTARPGVYPGDGAGGLTMRSARRLVALLRGGQRIAHPRQLGLEAIASDDDRDAVFRGNGTAAFPSLYDRDVLAFFPFQVSRHRFVSAVYVMTRDLARRYTSHPAAGSTPFDLPAETFRLTVSGVDGRRARVALVDPLRGRSSPARIVSRTRHGIVVQLAATDSPRLLTIDDGSR